ncbi:hypothetical protein EHQ53_01425 [Leptospira langatensis]|uniref:Uncharacterized protein n=1 Tax=Leptospira langatensis TaxID=2484983 RepID=A0A5F1ZXC6_9LEPT|nr:hypothetical protein [Leptospira langatensis]TGJ98409.1 hypothetical protein EHO57_17565 [Leptospira langatensis]TGL43324.1 hypothetical protein EHQ53_01425 [Leptospira langatensis]
MKLVLSDKLSSLEKRSSLRTYIYISIVSIFLLECNSAKPISIDASSSVIGALLSDGSLGLFSGPSKSSVKVTVAGYQNLDSSPMSLTLTDTSTTLTQDLEISDNGTFSFSTSLDPGNPYSITLNDYTKGQACILTGDTGTAGSSSPAKIDCERTLVVAAAVTCCGPSGPPIVLYPINHKTSPFTIGTSVPISSSATYIQLDLIWNGNKYLLVWTTAGDSVSGQFFDIALNPIGSNFPIYAGGGTTIRSLAAEYNSNSDEFAIVLSDTTPAVKYVRLNSVGIVLNSNNVESLGAGLNFGNVDVIWDGSKYIVAFEEHNNLDLSNNLAVFSFTNGTASLMNRIALSIGIGMVTPTNQAFNGVIGVAFPNLLRTTTDTWLFFNRTNSSDELTVTDSSLFEWKNFSGSPTKIKEDLNPFSCPPQTDPANGLEFYVPHAVDLGGEILLNYELHCEEAISSPFLFDNIFHLAINPSNGVPGTPQLYTVSTGHNRSYGSSMTCRKDKCYTSTGTFINNFYLLDPNLDGTPNNFFPIAASDQGFLTVIQ